MKKIIIALCLLISSYSLALAEDEPVTPSFAKSIIDANSGFGREADPAFVKNALDSLDLAGLEMLRKIIKDDLDRNPRTLILPPESGTAAWEALGITYNIDKRLEKLEYSRIVEGILYDGEPGLFGTMLYKLKLNNGQIFDGVLVTPATILENCEDCEDSGVPVRVYIKECEVGHTLRSEVVMIKPGNPEIKNDSDLRRQDKTILKEK